MKPYKLSLFHDESGFCMKVEIVALSLEYLIEISECLMAIGMKEQAIDIIEFAYATADNK